ncbi:FliO/MopB family protein [Agromyces soli]
MDAVFLVLRVAVALGVVLAVIWVAHRRVARVRRRSGKTGLVRVVARQSLAPKASMVVVDADGRRLMLGVTEHGVSVLSDRPAPVADADFDAVLAAAVEQALPEASVDPAAPAGPTVLPGRSTAAASLAPASHGSRRGSILSAETWKRSLAGVKEGLGI